MNLQQLTKLHSQSAGTQVTDRGEGDAWVKAWLRDKQDKLDKLRRSVTPFPEDKGPLLKAAKRIEDKPPSVTLYPDELKRESYKWAMKRKYPRYPLNVNPGTTPLQPIQGAAAHIGRLKCHVVKER